MPTNSTPEPIGAAPAPQRRTYWTLVPCTPSVAENGRWTAACAMTEGYADDEHSHWLNPDGVETVTSHRPGERVVPNCYVRTRRN